MTNNRTEVYTIDFNPATTKDAVHVAVVPTAVSFG